MSEIRRLDLQPRHRILTFLRERIALLDDPHAIGEPLRGPLRQLWKYRVGNYRIICDLQDDAVVVLVLRIGHRCEIYRR